MEPESNVLWDKLVSHLLGEGLPAEREATEQWIQEDPSRRALVDQIKYTWSRLEQPSAPETGTAELRARIAARIGLPALNGEIAQTSQSRDAKRRAPDILMSRSPASSVPTAYRFLGAIAAVVLLVVGVVFSRRINQSSIGSSTLAQRYATKNGQQLTIVLTDGSRVVLGSASTLTVDPAFGRRNRKVTLIGEAYFTVASSSKRPFAVEAGKALVRVLGTEFDIRKYPRDTAVRVVVADGKISLRSQRSNANDEAILTRGALAFASDSGRIQIVPQVALDDYTGWLQNRLRFRDTPLRELIDDLSRAYDVDVQTTDSLLATQLVTLTASPTRESIGAVLDKLMIPLNAHYVRAGRAITIYPGRKAFPKLFNPHHPSSGASYGR